MKIFLLGKNQFILQSLIQTLTELDCKIAVNPEALSHKINQIDHNKPFLILFDINNPVEHFEMHVSNFKTSFPQANIWAIFNSSSQSLRKELIRIGFEKIISYEDNIGKIIQDLS